MRGKYADISIVTPVFNTGAYVVDLLDSLLRQTVAPREILLVDDGSGPATAAILADLAKRHPELIRLITLPDNRGPSRARNTAIAQAAGRYVMFVDSDDFLLDAEVLETLAARAEGCDFDMLAFKAIHFEQNMSDGAAYYADRWYGGAFQGDVDGATIHSAPMLYRGMSLWNYLYDADFLRTRGVPFDEDLGRREDFPFIFMNLLHAKRLSSFDRKLIAYRLRQGSIMRAPDAADLGKIITGYDRVLTAYTLAGQRDTKVGHFLDLTYMRSVLDFARDQMVRDGSVDIGEDITRFRRLFVAHGAGAMSLRQKHADSAVPGSKLSILPGNEESRLLRRRYNALVRSDKAVVDQIDRECRARADGPKPGKSAGVLPALHGRKLVLHVGLTKTGTTALQQFLDDNRKVLSPHICYPCSGLLWEDDERGSGHGQLFREIAEGHQAQVQHEVLEELAASAADVAVLSCENLSWEQIFLSEAFLESVRKLFEGMQIKVIMTTRDPVDHFISQYKEDIRQPYKLFVGDPLEFYRLRSVDDRWNYGRTFQRFQAVFGVENCTLLRYEDIRHDAVGEILSLVAPDLPGDLGLSPRQRQVNRSIADDDVAARRILNIAQSAILHGDVQQPDLSDLPRLLEDRKRCLMTELEAVRLDQGHPALDAGARQHLNARLGTLFGTPETYAHCERLLAAQGRRLTDYVGIDGEEPAVPTVRGNYTMLWAYLDLWSLVRGRRKFHSKDMISAAVGAMILQYVWLLAGW